MDPFRMFPLHCIEIFMNHLNGFDFREMRKVSPEWNLIIKKDNRAFKELRKVFTLDIMTNSCDKETILLNDYKVKITNLKTKTTMLDYLCMVRFSTSIHNLEIMETRRSAIKNQPGIIFPCLKYLSISYYHNNNLQCEDVLQWISKCSFPALSIYLVNLGNEINKRDYKMIQELVKNMPSLEKFYSEDSKKYKSFNFASDDLNVWKSSYNQQFLEALAENHGQKLIEIAFSYLDPNDVDFILENFTKLKVLYLNHFQSSENLININTNIKKLYLEKMFESSFPLLKSLPSLEMLEIRQSTLTKSTINFLAYNNLNLMKIRCERSFDDDLQEIYEELKQSEMNNDNFNKNIKIVLTTTEK